MLANTIDGFNNLIATRYVHCEVLCMQNVASISCQGNISA